MNKFNHTLIKRLLNQFKPGFSSRYSTDMCLVHLPDKGSFVGMVKLNLQKEFATIDHIILLIELEALGLKMVQTISIRSATAC